MSNIEYRGYIIRNSGKDLYKIVTNIKQDPFFTRYISIDACKVAIDCRIENRVMSSSEHVIVYPIK